MLINKNKSKKTKGVIQASVVALHQGFEGVLFTFLFLTTFFIEKSAPFGAAVLGVKELLALAIMIITTLIIKGPKFFKELLKKFKSKQGKFFIFAGMIGTSLGNLFYILGVSFAGSGYGVVLTALYPVFSMLLIKFFMKEKEPKLVWVGVFVATISGLLLLIMPILIEGESDLDVYKIIGMCFGLLAALFWALEGLFINLGVKVKQKNSFTNREIIMTRNIFTTLTTFIIILPITLFLGDSFNFVKQIFVNWDTFLVVLAIALNIIVLRVIHVKAISNIGAKLTAAIDTNNFIIPAILAQIFVLFEPLESAFRGSVIEWWAYLLLIPIGVGVFMVIYFHKEKDELNELPHFALKDDEHL